MNFRFIGGIRRFAFHWYVVTLGLSVERCATDAKHLARESLVAVCLLEDAEDGHAFHLRERGRGK